MNRARPVMLSTVKEIRALLPLWAACVAALVAARVGNWVATDAATVAYLVGPLAIGAYTIGHEYAYGTLSTLLTQPADRRRLYATKFVVAAAKIVTIATLAAPVLRPGIPADSMWRGAGVQVLPLLGGLFVAPWFTMLTGSAIAGLLFTASVAALTHIAAIAAVALWRDTGADAAQAVIIGPWNAAMIAFCVVAGVLGTRRFTRLEATEARGLSIHLPRWHRGADRLRARRPVRAMVIKELRLQQLTFVLAGVFTVMSLVLIELQRTVAGWANAPIAPITLLYCMCLAILAGALASAEERQLATLEWQLLQPVSVWQQWIVKVVVTFGISLVFAVALPYALLQFVPGHHALPISAELVGTVLLLTSASVYLSSVTSSGVRAMVMTVPAGAAAALFFHGLEWLLRTARWHGTIGVQALPTWVIAATVAPPLLWFALANHRTTEQSAWRTAWQVALVSGAAAITIAA